MRYSRRSFLAISSIGALSACSSQRDDTAPVKHSSSTPPSSESSNVSTTVAPSASAQPPSPPQLDHTSADSFQVLVNKTHPLKPLEWTPPDLVSLGNVQVRAEVAQYAEEMMDDAARQGAPLATLSGFRSYETQVGTYNSWVSRYGQEQADVASARPGFSEHQTGLAIDFGNGGACDLQVCFRDSPQSLWLAENAFRYGFVLRFPFGEHEITGYWYESWHYRFIGIDEAKRFQSSSAKNLESFWGFEAAPEYKIL